MKSIISDPAINWAKMSLNCSENMQTTLRESLCINCPQSYQFPVRPSYEGLGDSDAQRGPFVKRGALLEELSITNRLICNPRTKKVGHGEGGMA